jgi:hypothetical protein
VALTFKGRWIQRDLRQHRPQYLLSSSLPNLSGMHVPNPTQQGWYVLFLGDDGIVTERELKPLLDPRVHKQVYVH